MNSLKEESNELNHEQNRKLILYFDIRNTVALTGSKTGTTAEMAVNVYLAGVTWGESSLSDPPDTDQSNKNDKCTEEHLAEIKRNWKWASDKLSLQSPNYKAHYRSYYRYLETHLCRKPADRPELRKALAQFTNKGEPGEIFRPYYEQFLKLAQWNHDNLMTNATLQSTQDPKKHYHNLLPSFLHLIRYLKNTKREYAIVFRTFGIDSVKMLNVLEGVVLGEHPEFPDLKDINLDIVKKPGKFQIDDKGTFSISFNNQIIRGDKAIYKFFSKLTNCVIAVQDNFDWWQSHHYDYRYSKPIWVNLYHQHIHHIIFDDNIRCLDDDCVVHVRMAQNRNDYVNNYKNCSANNNQTKKKKNNNNKDEDNDDGDDDGDENHEYLSADKNTMNTLFNDVCLCQIDLLANLKHSETYYVQLVKSAEESYGRLLKKNFNSFKQQMI
ncbi:hypothetical protein SNEBB_009822 [Seison nebaliae]|nr:hypothetical protein SNEBB_009822 [Seison nebaliae]